MNAWSKLAGIILRNKIIFLGAILAVTFFFGFQATKIKLNYKNQSILPADHRLMKEYRHFHEIFPPSDNVILLGVRDSMFFTPQGLNAWKRLIDTLRSWPQIKEVIGPGHLPVLRLNRQAKKYEVVYREISGSLTPAKADDFKRMLLDSLPFYHGYLINPSSRAVAAVVYMDSAFVYTKKRVNFIARKLIPALKNFETQSGMRIHTSGLLYIRTLNGINLKEEIPVYVMLTLLVAILILWLFFRSWPPIFISLTIVAIASIWSLGLMGLAGFKITILTAIIPALIIVIGVPNTIFLINKYQQEIISHGNRARSLQRVITKTGNAILMTNLTTAMGFATFLIVHNKMLREFGIVASFGVLSLFALALLLIPIIYSFLRVPKEKHLRHLEKKWINRFIDWLVFTVKNRRITVFSLTILLIVVSIIGLTRIRISGSILSDLPHNETFYHDIKFFEREFGGILPLDFMVDTGKPKGVFRLKNLKKMDLFQNEIELMPALSKPVSIVNVVKFAKQAFYRDKPEYFTLPTRHEKNFMLPYIKQSGRDLGLMKAYVDSTGRYARITTYMKDIDIPEMQRVEDFLTIQQNRIFPHDKYKVFMTGDARLFLAGTEYLLNNLFWSLSLAILLISGVIYWMFRSKRTMIVSMIPNLLPLLFTAGVMGYGGIPLKPSTILIFGITLGISVDDTIHFLTKYREELKKHHWRVRKAIIIALRETGISMFYTSTVLFFGFLVFLISDYGGTKALGGLVSLTLLIAMFSNLILLPALLLFLDKMIANKKSLHG